MYEISNTVINYLSSISFIRKEINSDWIQILCPFCDDSSRKSSSISHGHFYICRNFNYCHCFRCDYANSFSRALISLGFNDKESLAKLTQNNTSNFFHFKNSLDKSYKKIDNRCEEFKSKHPKEFIEFQKYIYYRCGDIDIEKFLLMPRINNGWLMVDFYNSNGFLVTSRYLSNKQKIRYVIPNGKKYYYFFQDIYNISDFSSIVICEGIFDLINLYRYYEKFRDSFFIAINGKQFSKAIKELLCNYLLIGDYTFNIVFDNDSKLNMPNKLINSCKEVVQLLNPNCNINFYIPSTYKDISELTQLEIIRK